MPEVDGKLVFVPMPVADMVTKEDFHGLPAAIGIVQPNPRHG
jgi:hypothetical protein